MLNDYDEKLYYLTEELNKKSLNKEQPLKDNEGRSVSKEKKAHINPDKKPEG